MIGWLLEDSGPDELSLWRVQICSRVTSRSLSTSRTALPAGMKDPREWKIPEKRPTRKMSPLQGFELVMNHISTE